MASPAKNSAVRVDIVIGVLVRMVCLPRSYSCWTPVIPFQFFPALLTFTVRNTEAEFNIIFGKCHVTPPLSVRNYIIAPILEMSSYVLSRYRSLLVDFNFKWVIESNKRTGVIL